ncbi:sulfatase [Microbacterium marmarense]|uniref:Sulfatase n=1 Tax=Microbacterium marmarense TaxID=3122051 RepID=A0ABU8LQQ4_9MICO
MARPNFLFISTHDINPHLGCYAGVWPGAEEAVTPRLDALAAEGVRFDSALAAAPVCAPARSAIFTGVYPTAAGTMHMRANAVPPPEVQLVPEILRRAGYFATNNWFTDFQFDVPPTAFDYCGDNAHWRDRPDPQTPFFAAFHSLITHESKLYEDGARLVDVLSQVAPDARRDAAEVTLPPYYPDLPEFRTAWANYLNLISAMDQWVGRLVDDLAADGLSENTVVIFWSDHGIGMPGGKRWAAEAGLRVPLIVRWPAAIAGGQVRTDVVETMDLAATILEIAGVKVPENMDSAPLISSAGAALVSDGLAFGARDRMMDDEDTSRTVRDDRYRYIRHMHPDRSPMQFGKYPDQFPPTQRLRMMKYAEARQVADGELPSLLTEPQRRLVATTKEPEEFYDLVNDPHQTTNLIADPTVTDHVSRLREQLDQWMRGTGDLGLKDELDLIRAWSPGGVRPQTDTPEVEMQEGMLRATSTTEGASIGWTKNEPDLRPPQQFEARLGRRIQLDLPWNVYTDPIPQDDGPVWFRAWRLGFEPSETVRIG